MRGDILTLSNWLLSESPTHGNIIFQRFIRHEKWMPGVSVCVLERLSSPCLFPPLTRLHISLGTSKVLVRYFQVRSLQGFSGVSVGVLENCVYRSFAKPFCSQTLRKCPRMESSSVLKRPSDSNSALFSVTPRDHLVYASGSVRSTASNNAPYIDGRVWQSEKHTHTSSHAYPSGHKSYKAEHVQKLWQNPKWHQTQRVHTHTHSHIVRLNRDIFESSVTKCIKVCCGSSNKMSSQGTRWSILSAVPKK